MNSEDTYPEIPKHALESFSRRILPIIQQFFDSEEGKREFEDWQAKQIKVKEVINNNVKKERN